MVDWRRNAIFLALAIGVLGLYIFLAEQAFGIGFPSDDAWIHQTYGRNLAKNGEWSVVPGQTSVASTSPLYTLFIALGHFLGLAPFIWTYGLGALTLALIAILAAQIAQELFPTLPHIAWITGLFIVLSWQLIWTAGAGMETLLYAALGLALMRLSLFEVAPSRSADPRAVIRRGLGFGVLGGLLTLTRPEGVLMMGVFGLFALFIIGRQNPRRYVLWVASIGLSWFILIAPYVIFNYSVIGELLPSTGSAKRAEYADLRKLSPLIRFAIMLFVLMVGAQLPAVFGMIRGVWMSVQTAQQDARHWINLAPFIWGLAHVTLYVLVLPIPNQNGRYVLPALPMILIYASAGLIDIAVRGRGSAVGRVLSSVYVLSVAGALIGFVWIGGSQAYAKQVRIYNSDMIETAKWIEANIPDGELMAAHDIGVLGYYAPRPILDLAGLISPEVVPIIQDKPALVDLMCEREVRWIMGRPGERAFSRDDTRITEVYVSPYTYFDEALPYTDGDEPNRTSVYAVNCD